MPAAVIGATSPVGRSLVSMLIARGGEVRVSVPDRDEAERFRAQGAKAAVGTEEDEDVLWPLLQDAHTLCLVGTNPLASDEDTERVNLGLAAGALPVAIRAGVHRVLLLSSPGASTRSENATLRALGGAEELVRGSGLEYVVIRATHLVGPGSSWLALTGSLARRRPPVVVGPGTQVLAPVHTDDVARILAAADDRADAVRDVLGAEGPHRLSADQAADQLVGRPRRWKRHVDRAPGLGTAASGILTRDSLADAPSGYARFGLIPTEVLPLLPGTGAGGG